MTLLSGLTYPKPLGAIVGLSGYLPLRQKIEQLRTPANAKTPVWLGHGTADPVVNYKVGSPLSHWRRLLTREYGKMTAEALTALGMQVSFNSYSCGHTADPKEIDDLAKFLTKALA